MFIHMSQWWNDIYIKAFAKRFDFDDVRTSQTRTDSQNQGNGGRPLGMFV